jgi:hypothetical protein
LSSQGAKENSVPAKPDYSQQLVYGPDATVGTNSNIFTIDSTTGINTPEYNGVGNLSATTLAANAYFRQFATYVDTTDD